jgi:hypothetical protein
VHSSTNESGLISCSVVDGLANAGGTGAGAVSVLSAGSSLIFCVLVETTDLVIRVLVLFCLKPGHVLAAPSWGTGLVFFAAGLRSSSFEGLSFVSLAAERSCLFLARFLLRSLHVPVSICKLAFRLPVFVAIVGQASCVVSECIGSVLIMGAGLRSACAALRPILVGATLDRWVLHHQGPGALVYSYGVQVQWVPTTTNDPTFKEGLKFFFSLRSGHFRLLKGNIINISFQHGIELVNL